MTIKTTQWGPDTCECVIEYSWDDSQPEGTRQHNLSRVVKRCPEHTAGPDSAVWNVVGEENPRKNRAIDEIVQRAPDQFVDIAQDGTRTLKEGITIDFEWTGSAPNRIIRMIVKGVTLTQPQFNTLQGRLDTRFGPGKVILVQG